MATPPPDVVVVDDDPLMVTILERYLARRGWRVRPFSDAHSALASVLADVPRVVVTDWEMPGLDGLALCAALRERLGSHAPKLVLMTADKGVRHAKTEHLDLVVGKPFRLAAFEQELRALAEDTSTSHTRLSRQAAREPEEDEQQSGT